ncbi:MAG: hypothetical protein WAN50_02280 [Minisyncoccia bacterium]
MPTLNDIIPPSRRREVGPSGPADSQSGPPQRLSRSPQRRNRFPWGTLIAVVIIVAASAGVLMYFSTARVEVTPNTINAAVQNSFTASNAPVSASTTGQTANALPYQIITAQKVASQDVKGTGTKTVNSLASGTITIYNTQAKVQRLVATTRFATASGLIFRIHTGVTVPAGSNAKPGSVSATVYADQNGSTYNVGPSAFTLPGLAGTPQAAAVYARSTAAFSGGQAGTVPVTDPNTEAQTTGTLITALAPDLDSSLKSQIPSGYTLLPGAATTTFQELAPQTSSSTGMVTIREQGTITAVVFPNAALAKTIALSISGLTTYQGEPLTFTPSNNLTLTPIDIIPTVDTAPFNFSLSGTATLLYTVDPTRIAAAVSGKSISEAEVALTNYPEVKRAIITLRPFWRRSFPEDPSQITITVDNP